ncbi:hypothetical protein AB0I28_21925 [Phytomonospora sp. NPDC050363]|uniref:hypothetical protein n=1 Tax=Phytomonospora sp. NPDC050363 TaxID=3155642 RepID=UPI0033FBD5F7
MHTTLAEHARCLYGDEYRPTPECDRRHGENRFVEVLTFSDAEAILAMLQELCPHIADGHLPVWVRNLAYRLVLLQRPNEPKLMRAAAASLWMHGPDWDDIAAGLEREADALEAPGPVAPGV